MTLIETINLRKTYTLGKNIQTEALRGIDLKVETKDFLVIAGPSGSGKSTLLNLLGVLDTASEGKILFEGKDLTPLNPSSLSGFRLYNIGFIFQAYNLITTLTARENVEYIMLLQGIDPGERQEKSLKILTRVGLKDYINRYPNEMSGGQQQRVAVARAIVSHPKVVLADEPTANLDSKTAESLIDLMLELNEEKGITFVFSTHDQLIMKRGKKLILLRDGKVLS